MEYEVFISYSRKDANRIAPIVQLVRAMKKKNNAGPCSEKYW